MAQLLPVILLGCCLCLAAARPMAPMAVHAATPSPKDDMPVPCYLKYYHGFCFTSNDKQMCTFYANPSYATFKQCSEDPNMGKTVKCADVDSQMRQDYADSYKTCADKEVLRGGSTGSTGGATPYWSQMSNMDVAGKDIPSGNKPFTEVCGDVEGVKQQCIMTSGCVGFTHDGKCGYLKTAVGVIQSRSGWTVFAVNK